MNYYTIIFFIIFIFSININKVIASDYNADSILTQGKPKPNENKSFFDKVKDFVTSKKGLIIVISSGAIILFILLLLIFLIIKKIRKNKRKNHYVEANNQEFYKDPNNYESNINKNNSYNYNEIYMNDSKKNDNNHHFNIDIKLSEDELNEESIPNENIPIAHSKNSTPMNSIRASDYQFNSNYKNNDDMYSDYDDKRYPSNNRNRNNSPLSPNYNSKSPISPKYNSNNRNNDPMSPNYNYNSNSRNNTLNSNYNSNGRNYNYNSNNRNNNFKNGSDESSKGNMNMKYNNNNHTSYETEEDNDISSISYDYNVSPYEKLIQNKPEHINVFDRESNPNRTSSLLSEDDINRLNGYLNKENNSNGGDNDSFIPSYYNDENLNNEDSENNVPIEFRNLQTYRVIHNFVPHRSDELEIEKGHLLKIIKSFEDGWALCYNINTKVKGFIPKNKLRIEDEPKPKMNVKAESMERNKMTNNIDKDSNNLNDNKNENNSENEDIQNVGKDDIKVVPNFQQGQIVLKFSDENKKKVEHQIVIEDGMLSRDNSCHVVYDYTDTSISFMNTPNLSNVKTASYQKDESFNQEHSNDNLLKPGRNYVPVKSKLRSVESTDDDDECYPRSSILSQQSVQQLSLSRQFLSSSQVPSSSTQRKRSSSQPAKPRDEGLYSHRPRPRSRSQGRYELSRYNEYRRSNRISDNLERNSVLSIDTNVYRNRYRRPNQEREVNEFYEDEDSGYREDNDELELPNNNNNNNNNNNYLNEPRRNRPIDGDIRSPTNFRDRYNARDGATRFSPRDDESRNNYNNKTDLRSPSYRYRDARNAERGGDLRSPSNASSYRGERTDPRSPNGSLRREPRTPISPNSLRGDPRSPNGSLRREPRTPLSSNSLRGDPRSPNGSLRREPRPPITASNSFRGGNRTPINEYRNGPKTPTSANSFKNEMRSPNNGSINRSESRTQVNYRNEAKSPGFNQY